MDGGIASAMKRARVVFLRAVVRQGLTRDLAPRDAAAVGEDRKHQSVDAAPLLKNVQDFFHAFIRKRHRSHLDGDELLSGLCRRGTRGLGPRVFCGMARPRAAPEYGDGSASHVSQKATARRAHEGLFHGVIPSWLGSRLPDSYTLFSPATRNACQASATTSYSATEGTSQRTTAPSCLKSSRRPARTARTLVIPLPAGTTNSTCWGPVG